MPNIYPQGCGTQEIITSILALWYLNFLNLGLIHTRSAVISWDFDGHFEWRHLVRKVSRNHWHPGTLEDNKSIFVSTVLVDDWAPLGASGFAGRVITKFVPRQGRNWAEARRQMPQREHTDHQKWRQVPQLVFQDLEKKTAYIFAWAMLQNVVRLCCLLVVRPNGTP